MLNPLFLKHKAEKSGPRLFRALERAKGKGAEAAFHREWLQRFKGDVRPRLLSQRALKTNDCRICGEKDHWGNECPKRFEGSVALQDDPLALFFMEDKGILETAAKEEEDKLNAAVTAVKTEKRNTKSKKRKHTGEPSDTKESVAQPVDTPAEGYKDDGIRSHMFDSCTQKGDEQVLVNNLRRNVFPRVHVVSAPWNRKDVVAPTRTNLGRVKSNPSAALKDALWRSGICLWFLEYQVFFFLSEAPKGLGDSCWVNLTLHLPCQVD